MILTDKQREQMEEASRPLMKFLGENFHPHVKVIVDNGSSEFLEGSYMYRTEEFISD